MTPKERVGCLHAAFPRACPINFLGVKKCRLEAPPAFPPFLSPEQAAGRTTTLAIPSIVSSRRAPLLPMASMASSSGNAQDHDAPTPLGVDVLGHLVHICYDPSFEKEIGTSEIVALRRNLRLASRALRYLVDATATTAHLKVRAGADGPRRSSRPSLPW